MFLRGNLARAGLVDRGERHQGTYAAAYHAGRIVGVVAQAWNGMLLVGAPRGLLAAGDAVVRTTGRPVAGLCGAPEQVQALRSHLGLLEVPTAMDSREVLFGLDLGLLRVPAALARGEVSARRAVAADRDTLLAWSRAYSVETLGDAPGPDLDAHVAESVDAAVALGRSWVLEAGGALVAKTGFNAATPDCVQVGGGVHAAVPALPGSRALRGGRVAARCPPGGRRPVHPLHRAGQRARAGVLPGAGLPGARRLRPGVVAAGHAGRMTAAGEAGGCPAQAHSTGPGAIRQRRRGEQSTILGKVSQFRLHCPRGPLVGPAPRDSLPR